MTSKKPEKHPESQIAKFKAMAKDVGADGSEASFDKLLKKVAKTKKAQKA